MSSSKLTVGVVVRFKNSAQTLPAVLACLRAQSLAPNTVLGVNNGSTDDSVRLLSEWGARVVDWTEPYHHSKVLNFGVRQCPTDLVLALSSHTELRDPSTLERMAATFDDPATACASGKWDVDPFYGDRIAWTDLQTRGIKFGSIYSNSFGMFRRRLWETMPFDEAVPTMEDYAWSLAQVKAGGVCRRLGFDFAYKRGGNPRHFIFACITFRLAHQHGLAVRWLGASGSIRGWLDARKRLRMGGANAAEASAEAAMHRDRFKAWLLWRWTGELRE